MTDKALGIDVSRWNGKVDFVKAKANGVSFAYIKASQQTVDPCFKANWKNAKEAGVLRGAYHYFDWRKPELEQAELFVSLLLNDVGELPPICDFEMREAAPTSKSIGMAKLWNFMSYVEDKLNVIPGIYTGYYFWKEMGSADKEWAKFPFWLAWWRQSEANIRPPLPWSQWEFWQYDDKGDGKLLGCDSTIVDVDRFRGTAEELNLIYGTVNPPQVPLTDKEKLDILWKEHHG